MAIIFAQAATKVILRSTTRSGAPNPTGAPVLRGSLEEGTFEHRFWRVYEPKETDRLLRSAVDVMRMGRRERRDLRSEGLSEECTALLPRLTKAAIEVYQVLCTIGRLCEGKIFPSYETIKAKTELSRATIARAIKQLKDAGFLTKQRRSKRVEREGPGPRFEQTSNAYRLEWPTRLAKWLGYTHAPCPLPDDEVHRQQERLLAIKPVIPVKTDNSLEGALAGVERALNERESHNATQPQVIYNNINEKVEMCWPSRPTPKP